MSDDRRLSPVPANRTAHSGQTLCHPLLAACPNYIQSIRLTQALSGATLLFIARAAMEDLTKATLPPVRRQYPRPLDPWRLMTHVLAMSALQLRHPVALVVLVKSHDAPLQMIPSSASPPYP